MYELSICVSWRSTAFVLWPANMYVIAPLDYRAWNNLQGTMKAYGSRFWLSCVNIALLLLRVVKSSKGNIENPVITVCPKRGSCIKFTAPIKTDQIHTNKYLFGNSRSAKITRITWSMFVLIFSCASIIHQKSWQKARQSSLHTVQSRRNTEHTKLDV